MASLAEGEWRGPWIEAFLEFCAAEKLPVDFVSSHPYPTDFPLDEGGHYVERTRPVEATKTDLQWLRRTISASAFPTAEIHLTEWSSSPSPRDHSHDSLPAATYVVKTNIEASGLVDSLAYWTFTDIFEEGGAGDTIFHGGFGLLNFQGLAKPTFHAYRFLNQLGDVEIARGDGFIVTRKAGEQSPRILIWHYPAEIKDSILLTKSPEAADRIRQSGTSTRISISLKNLAPHQALLVEVLDSENGFVLPAWKAMGSPEPPTREQASRLREASFRTGKMTLTADSNGTLEWQGEMAPWALWLIREAGPQVA
jgi:xylan 1,4-beta-xylosidase